MVPPPGARVASPRPRFIIVTGEPGSGKSSLGRELAPRLRLPFLSRDDIRGGLLATAGLWTNQIRTPSPRELAVTTFVEVAETLAGLGVSAVLELIAFRDRRDAMRRLIAAADCVVIVTTCDDAAGRVDRRDRADAFLNREDVLAALGHQSIDDYLGDPQREIILTGMETTFELPTRSVRTDDGYDPPLEALVEWIVEQTRG